jgi:hypothetical protein
MRLTERFVLGRTLALAITVDLIVTVGGVGGAPQVATGIGVPPRTDGGVGTQQNPYQPWPNYQYGPIDPYGVNYNYDYRRYGPPGVGVSPWNPILQAQLNLGMRTARYNMMSAWSADMNEAANLYNQQAMAQAIENQRQMQAMQPRYDVRSQAPRTVRPSDRENRESLPRNQVVSPDGKVLWPGRAPNDGDLARSRSAAEAAVRVAVKEFEANGKASVQSVVTAKELLYAYGRPALQKLAAESDAAAKNLFRFLASLEQLLDTLAGV